MPSSHDDLRTDANPRATTSAGAALELDAIFQQSPTAMSYLDRGLVYRQINAAGLAFLERTAEQVLGQSMLEVFPGSEGMAALARRVIDSGEPAFFRNFPYRFRHGEESETRYFDWSAVPIRGASGAVMGVLSQAQWVTDRVHAERERTQLSRRLDAILADAPAGIAFADRDLILRQANRKFAEVMGAGMEDLLNRPLEHAIADFQEHMDVPRRVLETGEPFHESAFRWQGRLHAEGEFGYYDWSLTPIADEAGKTEGLIITVADVTERVRALEAAAERASVLDAVINSVPDGLALLEPGGRWVQLNEAAIRLFGPLGDPGLAMADVERDYVVRRPDGRQMPLEEWLASRALAGERVPPEPIVIQTPGGEVIHAELGAAPVIGPDGRRMGVIAMMRDVTGRVHMQRELQAERLRLRTIVEIAPVGIALLDARDGRVLEINPRFQSRLEEPWKSRSLIGLHPQEFVPNLDSTPILQVLRSVITTNQGRELVEVPYEHPSRGRTYWDLSLLPVSAGGRVDQVLVVIKETTDQVQAMQDLRAADEAKNRFLAMLAHELRNPLAPILNAVHILRLPNAGEAEDRKARDILQHQVQHMARLIDDLLDVSRITHGQIDLRCQPLDLSTVAQRAIETALPWIVARGHRMSVRLPSQPIVAEVDPVRLEQVLTNLLNNAAKYTPPGGSVELTVEPATGASGPEALIRVRDTGLGIGPELLPYVFDLFVQADRTLDRSQGGLGLGLTLVRRLVNLHGGTVEAHSDGPGRGSEFVVRLPAANPPAGTADEPESPAVPATSREAGDPAAQRRILVVEDNEDAAEMLAGVLRLCGHEVQIAHDGASALDAAAAFQPHVVLLDIGLPGMSGYQVARRLRAQTGSGTLRLVAVSGYGQEEDRRRAQEAGFDHHLTKPVDLEALQRLLI